MAMHILQMICTNEDRPKEHIYEIVLRPTDWTDLIRSMYNGFLQKRGKLIWWVSIWWDKWGAKNRSCMELHFC